MKDIFRDFFFEKRILITGHTGFIGSWLTILLNELGANIIGYALPPHTKKDNFVLANLEKKIVSILGDIRDFGKINDTFNNYQPEIVFHLAAQPLVRKSYLYPKEIYAQVKPVQNWSLMLIDNHFSSQIKPRIKKSFLQLDVEILLEVEIGKRTD